MRRAALLAFLVCGAGLASATPKGTSAGRLPYGLSVEVRWGGEAGSEAFRADLARGIATEFVERCFTRVVTLEGDPSAVEDDLLLTVVLANVRDETRFDDSIAAALTPGEPGEELRREAHFAVDVTGTLATRQGRRELRAHRLHVEAVRRPVMVGEDPQAGARAEAIERIVTDLRKRLCGGSANERSIREALHEAAPGESAR